MAGYYQFPVVAMKRYYHKEYKKYVYEIFLGGQYATKEENVIISTLLGSCVSACLVDFRSKVIGMNHFILPGDMRRQGILTSPRYGMYAMESLIESMVKLGARRKRIEARVFGGGSIVNSRGRSVQKNNIDFIKAYLGMEGIPIMFEDLGGDYGRKIYFFSDTFEIHQKKIERVLMDKPKTRS